jgi:hypothetical protein
MGKPRATGVHTGPLCNSEQTTLPRNLYEMKVKTSFLDLDMARARKMRG